MVRNDAITVPLVSALSPAAIILSPRPGNARRRRPQPGDCHAVLPTQRPMLGVCLGHQTLAAAFGGRIVRAIEPVHGRSSEIQHAGRSLFAGLPNPLRVGRYHSLIVEAETLPALPVAAGPYDRRHVDGVRTCQRTDRRTAVSPRVGVDRTGLRTAGGVSAQGGPATAAADSDRRDPDSRHDRPVRSMAH